MLAVRLSGKMPPKHKTHTDRQTTHFLYCGGRGGYTQEIKWVWNSQISCMKHTRNSLGCCFFCTKHTKSLCFVPLQQDINFQVPQEWLACVHTIHLWPLKQGSKFTQAIKFCTDLQQSILTTMPYPSLHTSGHKINFAPSKMTNWVNQTSLVHSFNSLTPSKHHFNLNIQIWKSNIKNTTWTFSCANQLQRTQITS